MNPVIETERLTKSYGRVSAVDALDLSLAPDRIYGLLGRNGAGKTTVMQLLTARLLPTGGQIRVFGESPYENRRVLDRICFIKESQTYPAAFRVKDVLELCAARFPNWDEAYARELTAAFELPRDRRIKALSRGMHSSVGIIIGLASRAPLTLFDEPYLGLDAVVRSRFYDQLLADFAEHPRTIILSTHLIDEVSRLLEHVLVIHAGRLLLDADAEGLRERAVSVVGPATGVDSFVAGREVMQREHLSGLVSAVVAGPLSAADRQKAKALGVETTPITLQQLIVQLTTHSPAREAVEAQ